MNLEQLYSVDLLSPEQTTEPTLCLSSLLLNSLVKMIYSLVEILLRLFGIFVNLLVCICAICFELLVDFMCGILGFGNLLQSDNC